MMVIMTKKAKKTTMTMTKMIMWLSRKVKLSHLHFGGPS